MEQLLITGIKLVKFGRLQRRRDVFMVLMFLIHQEFVG